MNGKERKISNQFTDDGKGLVSMISFTEFSPGEPLVAIDDDGSSTCVLSMAEYSSLSNTTNQHILSHRPLSECNVWALATHAPTVTLGVNVPPNVRHHLSEIHAISQRKSQDSLFFPLPEVAPVFSTPSGDYFATLRPQEVNNEPTYWESVPTQSPEEAMLDRWLYSEDDPLKLRFLKGPIDLSIDQFEEARLIDAAFESKGEIQPPYTRDTMAIHRFFTHWKLETGAFTRSPELKQRISSIASPQDLLNDDLMQVPLARFIQLMKVKDAFLAKFNQYRSPLPVSNDWDAFCLLKDQVANEFNIF